MNRAMKVVIVLGVVYLIAIICLAVYSLNETSKERLACEAQGRVFVTKVYGKVLYHACVERAAVIGTDIGEDGDY